jgi:glycosyltransferase involved in cell wall biosynthesis
MSDLPFISIVIPCYNEEKFIEALMQNLMEQDYPKELLEIIFADGNSTDGTRQLIKNYMEKLANVVCLDNPERYVPTGLNRAIHQSKGEIIIRMDAHSVYPSNYCTVLVEKLHEHHADNVGGVWDTQPGADTNEAKAIVLATSHPLGIGNADYRLGGDRDKEVDTVPFGCFRRDVFERFGYFDPQLIRNQDDELNGRIVKGGGKIVLIPSLKIKYFARENREKLAAMFYQYGLFKPLVNIKLGSPATLRQFVPPIFVASLTVLLLAGIFSLFFLKLFFLELFIYGIAVGWTSFTLTNNGKSNLFVHTLLTFPVIHISYGIGYIFGIIKFVFMRQHLKASSEVIKSNR